MPLHRRTTQQQVNLVIIVAEPSQVLDHPQRRLSVRHRGIHVMLLPVLVDAEPFEGEVATGSELRLHGALVEDGGFHAEIGHAVFHDAEFQGDDAGHFNGAAKGYFAVALWIREKEIGELVGKFWEGREAFEWGYQVLREKWRSPTLNLAPLTWTGR